MYRDVRIDPRKIRERRIENRTPSGIWEEEDHPTPTITRTTMMIETEGVVMAHGPMLTEHWW
jgi:hypothetical protein